MIKSNEFIIECKEVKAVMIGSVKFRFFAEVTYDILVLFILNYSNNNLENK